jgi:hypothetical protein
MMKKKVIISSVIVVLVCALVVRVKLYAPEPAKGEIEKPVEFERPPETKPDFEKMTDKETEDLVRETERKKAEFDKQSESVRGSIGTLSLSAESGKPKDEEAFKAALDNLGQQVEATKDWEQWDTQMGQDPVVEKAAKKLQAELQVSGPAPLAETTKKSLRDKWDNLATQLKITWQKAKLWFQEHIFKDKDAIIEIRNDLANLYASMGRGGLLDKARQDAQLAFTYDDLTDRIGAHLVALQSYKEATDAGKFQPSDIHTDELIRTINDLLTARRNLYSENIDALAFTRLQARIDKALANLGMTKEDRLLFENKIGLLNKSEVQEMIRELMRISQSVANLSTEDINYIKTRLSNIEKITAESVNAKITNLAQALGLSSELPRLREEIYTIPRSSQEVSALLSRIDADRGRIAELVRSKPETVMQDPEFRKLLANFESMQLLDLSNLSLVDQTRLYMAIRDAFGEMNAANVQLIKDTKDTTRAQNLAWTNLLLATSIADAETVYQRSLDKFFAQESERATEVLEKQRITPEFTKNTIEQVNSMAKNFFEKFSDNMASVQDHTPLDTAYKNLVNEMQKIINQLNAQPVSRESLQIKQAILDTIVNPLLEKSFEAFPYPASPESKQWHLGRIADMAALHNKYTEELEFDRSMLIAIEQASPNDKPEIAVYTAAEGPQTEAAKQEERKKKLNLLTEKEIRELQERNKQTNELSQADIKLLGDRLKVLAQVPLFTMDERDELLTDIKKAPVLRHVEMPMRKQFIDILREEAQAKTN